MSDLVTLTLALDDGAPPREFRLFAAGLNETSKGPALFDASAAKAVMAAYERGGVDLMIDLEHLSLDSGSPRADSFDARGWAKLELRDGELWAVDVRWTPDGEERLRSRKQRYISPAFLADKKGRPMRLVNVALVAMPATYRAQALVAASRRVKLAGSMNDLRQALQEAVIARFGENTWLEDVYEGQAIFYDQSGGLKAIAYAYADDRVEFSGQPIDVVRSYVPVEQAIQVRANRFKREAKWTRN